LTTATVGASAGDLGWTMDSDNNNVEIVTHVHDGHPVKTRTVPSQWYRQKQRAEEVKDQLFDRYRNVPGILGVGLTAGKSAIGELRYFNVEVIINDWTGTETSIPESVEDIPVTTYHRGPLQDAGGCELNNPRYRNDYDPIPGGVHIESAVVNNSSSCCRVRKDGQEFLMAARHSFIDDDNNRDSCSTRNILYAEAQQNGNYYGYVVEEYPEYDTVLTELDTDGNRSGLSGAIIGESGLPSGHISKDGVDSMISDSNSETVYKQGVNHCEGSGQVESREDNYCSSIIRKELVRTTVEFGNGDSGGPVYDVQSVNLDDHLFMIHIATQWPPSGCDSGYGSGFYAINNDYSVEYE